MELITFGELQLSYVSSLLSKGWHICVVVLGERHIDPGSCCCQEYRRILIHRWVSGSWAGEIGFIPALGSVIFCIIAARVIGFQENGWPGQPLGKSAMASCDPPTVPQHTL
jgi:hypothetical protein